MHEETYNNHVLDHVNHVLDHVFSATSRQGRITWGECLKQNLFTYIVWQCFWKLTICRKIIIFSIQPMYWKLICKQTNDWSPWLLNFNSFRRPSRKYLNASIWSSSSSKQSSVSCIIYNYNIKYNYDFNCNYNYNYNIVGGEFAHLFEAVNQGLVDEDYVNNSVSRLIKAMIQLGEFDPPEKVNYH